MQVGAQVSEKISEQRKMQLASRPADVVQTAIGKLELPAPYSSKSTVKVSKIIGWKDQKPDAPAGFTVVKFAENLQHPRSTYVGTNGDIFVVESNTRNSANRIILLRDTNGDGKANEQTYF
jgi:glucose/arabinose dehydrogenase